MPPGFRRRAIAALDLHPGDRVLEIGCGTGRNFRYLHAAVGWGGHIYGVDLSETMLERARAEIVRRGFPNVTLTRRDAATYSAQEPLDAILFGFSYSTMPHHLAVLRHALKQLRPGGHVVIMDAKLPSGWLGKLILPFAIWLMRHTLLSNPLVRPWECLAAMTERFEMREFLLSSYYVCHGTKPREAKRHLTAAAKAATSAPLIHLRMPGNPDQSAGPGSAR